MVKPVVHDPCLQHLLTVQSAALLSLSPEVTALRSRMSTSQMTQAALQRWQYRWTSVVVMVQCRAARCWCTA